MVKFEDELTVKDGMVIATGPFDPSKEEIVELCAWVFQRDDDDRNDLAATEMTDHHHPDHPLLRQGEGELTFFEDPRGSHHWRLPVARVGDGDVKPGKEAFAVAVAMIKEKQNNRQRVIWWGHPVMMKAAPTA